jgi:DNA-3-methyladenine glycosylase II
MTPDDYARARRALMRRDPVLGAAIKKIGACGLGARQQRDAFTALVRAIVGQQLSAKAAATIFERLLTLFPDGTLTGASAFTTVDDTALRGVGLSGQKLSYVRDLCARMTDGRLALDALVELPDEEVITRLTEVRGFGRWTAEMFLIFRLNRPDVLPVGDQGIVRAVQQLYRLRVPPDAKRLTSIGERWRPYRSVACWYLWQTLSPSPPPSRR